MSSGIPSYLGQHAHPSIAFGGSLSPNITHGAWDAFDVRPGTNSRVILHRVMSNWIVPSTYYAFNFYPADRASITGLLGSKTAIVYQQGTTNFSEGTYNGSSWSLSSGLVAGRHPSFSVGSTQAKYVFTSGSAATFEVKLNSTSFSKTIALAEETASGGGSFKYVRAVGLVDTVTGAWVNVWVEDFLPKHDDGSVSRASFSDAPPDTAVLSSTEAWAALSSADFNLPVDAESLVVVLSIAGENAADLSNGRNALELQFKIKSPVNALLRKNFQPLTIVSNGSFLQTKLRIGVNISGLNSGALLAFTSNLSNQKINATVVASLGHIYEYSEDPNSAQLKSLAAAKSNLPQDFLFIQNYPNPFNPETRIQYQLSEASAVQIKIFNVAGQLVRSFEAGLQPAGVHSVVWDSKDNLGQQVSSGIYIYRLSVEPLSANGTRFEESRKLLLIR